MLANPKEKLPGRGEATGEWKFTLTKGHILFGLFTALIASCIVTLSLLAWSKERMLSNANCTKEQIKLTDYSGAGMSVTCMPILTYRDLKKLENDKEKAKRKQRRRKAHSL